jgi:putative aldouronate transport system permease protein
LINLLGLLIGFPAPILLALALNEIGSAKFKKTVQMVTYAPYFISTVVVVSILLLVLSPRTGFVNQAISLFGFKPINFMGEPEYFRVIYVLSDMWQHMGYSAIIYIAALAGVNPELYEAARVDGATRLQKIWNIDIPGIAPVMVILLILNVGNMMNIGFEKIYLMQNTLNLSTSEVIATYVYKVGLINANFSFSTAIGLFNSVINMMLLIVVNALANRISKTSLW